MIEEFIKATREAGFDQIEAAIELAQSPAYKAKWQERAASVAFAEKVMASIVGPNYDWIGARSRAVNAAITAYTDDKANADALDLSVLWAVIEQAATAILGASVLTPEKYSQLIEPVLGIMPALSEKGVPTASFTPEEIAAMATPYPKEKQTQRASPKAKPAPKTKTAAAPAQKPAAAPKTAKRAKPVAKPKAAATTPVAEATATLKADGGYLADQQAETFKAFIQQVPGYAIRKVTEGLGIGGRDRAKVAFGIMAWMAARSAPELKALPKAWAFWEPLTNLANPADQIVDLAAEQAKLDEEPSRVETLDEALAREAADPGIGDPANEAKLDAEAEFAKAIESAADEGVAEDALGEAVAESVNEEAAALQQAAYARNPTLPSPD